MKKSKKAAMPLPKLVGLILLLILLAVFISAIFAPSSLLPDVAEKALIFRKYIPGSPEVVVPVETKPPEDLINEFKRFCNVLEKSKEYTGCMVEYPALDSLGKFKIKMIDGENKMYIQLLNEIDQVTDYTCTIQGIVPCVVAGENKAAINFRNNYLTGDGPKSKENRKLPEFSDPASITITKKRSKKLIDIYYRHQLPDKKSDLKDDNIFLRPEEDNKRACFLPTFDMDLFWGCSANKKGLDANCMDNIKRAFKFKYCPIN